MNCLPEGPLNERGLCVSLPGESPLRLPDLYTLPPSDLRLYLDSQSERRAVRFSNAVVNLGPGVVELVGERLIDEETVTVRQMIYRSNGKAMGREVGETAFDPDHQHWHWTRFSAYEVWSVNLNGTLVRKVSESSKVGYCLRDNEPASRSDMAGLNLRLTTIAGQAKYKRCGWQLQGIQAGWTDIYDYKTPGQNIDLTGLPNGVYALKSTVDPDNFLLELDEGNNTAVVYFRLEDIGIVTLGENYP